MNDKSRAFLARFDGIDVPDWETAADLSRMSVEAHARRANGCPRHGWARPEHYDELRQRECPGWTEYRPGDLDAPCDTCGGRTGWRVAGPLVDSRP